MLYKLSLVLKQVDQEIINNNNNKLIVRIIVSNKTIKIKIIMSYSQNKTNINLQFIMVNRSKEDKGIIINFKNKIINPHFIILCNQTIMVKIIIINIIEFVNFILYPFFCD